MGQRIAQLNPMWNHWVVRTSSPFRPFEDFEFARWTWEKLAEHFPQKLGAVLMPNHIHLILPRESDKEIYKLRGLLGSISKRSGVLKLWQPIPIPSEIPDLSHLRRQLRYVALNPCRAGLCRDPLEWYWSTYREVIGATVKRRNSATYLAKILRESSATFRVRFHGYVSGDPSVQIAGTPFPHAAVPQSWAVFGIGEILEASAAVLLMDPKEVQRRGDLRKLFLHFARRHGWSQTSLLAQICKITPRSVNYILRQPAPAGILEADLCLGDPRLRVS